MYPGKHAQETPDKPAYVMAGSGRVVTYRELDERSNQCAWLFRELSLEPGDGIAIFMKNEVGFLEVCWGAQRSGLYFTPVSTHLTAEEIEYIVRDCGATVFIASQALSEAAAPIAERMTELRRCFSVGGEIPGFDRLEDSIVKLPTRNVPNEQEGSDIIYSSGTTGLPKGIKHPLPSNEIGSAPVMLARMLNGQYGMCPETVYLSPAPLYHSAPLRFNMCMGRLGATSIIMERFDAEQALAAVEKYRVTLSQWVPSMFVRLLKLPEHVKSGYDVSSQEVVLHAAAPCPVPIKAQMIEWWGPVITEYYGATEGHGATSIDSEDWLAHPGSVGQTTFGVIHIMDDEGAELPDGETGTIYFAGGSDFSYHNDPDKTASAKLGNGWATVGDVGYVDADGYLYLTDRKSNMIISGGVNIYPQETENLLITHPKVEDVAVFGVPNEDFGEEVKAVVQPMDFSAAGPELGAELLEFCKQNLSKIKCPRSIDFERELPRAESGKLFKRRLKERYWQGHETRLL
ncbi:MAG: AMP-binding protein [bacterium]|nr:AMP-binding protein [bacterium]